MAGRRREGNRLECCGVMGRGQEGVEGSAGWWEGDGRGTEGKGWKRVEWITGLRNGGKGAGRERNGRGVMGRGQEGVKGAAEWWEGSGKGGVGKLGLWMNNRDAE